MLNAVAWRRLVCDHWKRRKYSWMSLMALLVSRATASTCRSPRTTHPWLISANSTLPVRQAPNRCFSSSTISPPSFTFGGSFCAGSRKAGQRISPASFTSSPPTIFSTPSEGCGPAMAMNWSYLAASLKASQTPQQKPMAKNCLTPKVSRCAVTFSKRAVMTAWSWPLMLSTMDCPSCSLKGVTRISGRKTLQCRAAKRSATWRCLPLLIPKISEKMTSARGPSPAWQTVTPLTDSISPLGRQFACSCSHEPCGQQLISPKSIQGSTIYYLEILQGRALEDSCGFVRFEGLDQTPRRLSQRILGHKQKIQSPRNNCRRGGVALYSSASNLNKTTFVRAFQKTLQSSKVITSRNIPNGHFSYLKEAILSIEMLERGCPLSDSWAKKLQTYRLCCSRELLKILWLFLA